MPRKKKDARDMTSDELARKVFGPKAAKALKQAAHEGDDKPPSGRKAKGKASP